MYVFNDWGVRGRGEGGPNQTLHWYQVIQLFKLNFDVNIAEFDLAFNCHRSAVKRSGYSIPFL